MNTSSTAGSATYFGALILIVGGWTLTEWAIIVGAVVGIGGLAVKWWYEHRRTKNAKDHNDAMLSIELERLDREFPKGDK